MTREKRKKEKKTNLSFNATFLYRVHVFETHM